MDHGSRYVTLVRATDDARLYLLRAGPDAWLVTNAVAPGMSADLAIARLVGRCLDAGTALTWAAGAVTSAAIVDREMDLVAGTG
jgi:hypothetical protein